MEILNKLKRSNIMNLSFIEQIGIIPVIKINSADHAVPLAKALLDGGIPIIEITFRTDAAAAAIERITGEVPDILVGAGTVLSPEQADKACAAGARFIMSPGFNPRVVRHCLDKGMLIVPGCATPSEIEQALEHGLDCVKFFPAEQIGGLAAIRAMSAPYGGLSFVPTGGIHAGNLREYLAFERVVACGGSWMADAALINAGDFAGIEELTREAVRLVREARNER
jgi:2-dehydro-3-deoxyphosphogluconate aldolase/(4S)-4-hydroxy-2-oxoglutarate aldolase